jgi:ribosomal protein L40E
MDVRSHWIKEDQGQPGICPGCSAEISIYAERCPKCRPKKSFRESWGLHSDPWHVYPSGKIASPVFGFRIFIGRALGAICCVLAVGRIIIDVVNPPTPHVHVAVSVDWEGRDMSAENLQAFADFRAAHPEVPLTHFLNAAYFTKPDADGGEVSEKMRQVLDPIDELGLHIHPWKSLVEAAGVTFRTEPTIWGKGRRMRPGGNDVGHEISVEAYETDEFQKVVRKSKEILTQHGFELGRSFRAGAWLAGPRVREAIRREGFKVDSSATDTKWHSRIAQYDLPAMIREIWPDVTSETQPFWIMTPAGTLLEMPDTGALADYVTVEDMSGHIADAVAKLDTEGDRFVHIGFHQETAASYAPRVIAAIREAQAAHGGLLIFETLEASARHASRTFNLHPSAFDD